MSAMPCPKCGKLRKVDIVCAPDGWHQPPCYNCGDPGYIEPFEEEEEQMVSSNMIHQYTLVVPGCNECGRAESMVASFSHGPDVIPLLNDSVWPTLPQGMDVDFDRELKIRMNGAIEALSQNSTAWAQKIKYGRDTTNNRIMWTERLMDYAHLLAKLLDFYSKCCDFPHAQVRYTIE